ncbi:hypothetical protein AMR72_02510 [Flavobacterium psychrophilum]|nr:hypothetical protein AMR72_02510 [Flavobacterium psychrophilum]AOE51490.1 hypothetical protein ALW18_02510 [Flavobacterium psychrophilum]
MATVAPQNSVGTEKNVRMPVPRLEKLIIKNFRYIGSESLEIDGQHLAIIAGYENPENDSISRTYDVIMHHHYVQPPLDLEDFHNGLVDPENLPEVELHSITNTERIDAQWLDKIKEGEYVFKEKWIWERPSLNPTHTVFNTKTNTWSVSNMSKTDKLNPLDNKDVQLCLLAIVDRAINVQRDIDGRIFENQKLVEKLRQFQDKIIKKYNNKFRL